MNDQYRQTGRTTELLKVACRAAREGRNVAFLVHNDSFTRYAVALCRSAKLLDGATWNSSTRVLSFPGRGSIGFYLADERREMDRFRGGLTLADHHVWEIREESAIRQALREVSAWRRETELWSREFVREPKAEG